jgi:Fe-S cluster assembly protein SufD
MSERPNAPVSLETWLEGGADQLPGAGLDWLDAERSQALTRVRESGVPTGKSEGWRYTGVKSLLEQPFLRYAEPVTGVEDDDLDEVLIPGLDTHRVVLVNGRFVAGLSRLGALPAGVRAGSLREILESDPDAVADRLTKVAGDCAHVFSALNTAGMDEPRVAQPRHLVALEEGAQASLIERYVSLGESLYCTNSVLEISLARATVLRHQRIQLESPNAFHITGVYLSQGADSRYQGVNIGLGAAWARTDLVVRFAGEHAECDLRGLYLAGDKQVIDHHLDVDHGVPHCASRENFKGILYGKGRAVFDGRIHVAVDAQKTDAQLSNKNLLLSRNAEIDTKPQLEIHADDVKCSHGTTVGQIDPQMLFYLRSRGISAPLARRMLCLGFAGEIIEALGPEPLREYVAEEVGRRLETTPLE